MTRSAAALLALGLLLAGPHADLGAGEAQAAPEPVRAYVVLQEPGAWHLPAADLKAHGLPDPSEVEVLRAGRPVPSVVAEDGIVVDLVDGRASISGKVDCGYVFVDGSSVGDITETSLKDRRILGEEGFISVIVVVDSVTGKVAGGPEIHARGFAEDDATFDGIKQPIIDAVAAASRDGVDDSYQLQQVIRRVVGRWVSGTHRRRPMIIPVVIEA